MGLFPLNLAFVEYLSHVRLILWRNATVKTKAGSVKVLQESFRVFEGLRMLSFHFINFGD